MRKLFDKKRYLKIVSAFLVLSMVIGAIGNYPIVSKAAETVATGDFYTNSTLFNLEECTEGGVKVTHTDSVDMNSALTTSRTWDASEGVHFEVEGITTPYADNEYSFVTYMGYEDKQLMNYGKKTVAIAISSNGNYKVWRTADWNTADQVFDPKKSDTTHTIATGTLDNKPSGGCLSFDIQVVSNGEYKLTVEGNESITLTEPGDAWHGLSAFRTARFGLSIWPSITDTEEWLLNPWNNDSKGATYTIKDISKTVVKVTDVSLDRNKVTLTKGKTATLNAMVAPENAEDKSLVWTSDNVDVATVKDGVVTAIAKGSATITAKSVSGNKTAECKVSVVETAPGTGDFYTNSTLFNLEECTEGGVKVTHTDSVDMNSALTTSRTWDASEGVHFEVEGITTPYADNEYSFVTYMGCQDQDTQLMNYGKKTVVIAISSNGNYKVWKTADWSDNDKVFNPKKSDTTHMIATGTLENKPSGNRLSFDIQVVKNGEYKLTVEGNESITLTEASVWYGLSAFQNARFGLSIWPAITDTEDWSLDPWNKDSKGATYTIKDISVNDVVEYTAEEFATLRADGKKAPERSVNFVFAGWYYDEGCTNPVEQTTVTLAEGQKVYAKFVPNDVLSVKAQLKLPTDTAVDRITADSKVQMRLVTTVDSLNYRKVGFRVTSNEIPKEFTTTTAYTSITAAGVKVEAKEFSVASNYFITKNLGNITVGKNTDREIIVQAFWETMDGTIVYGEASTKTIQQGLNAAMQTQATTYSR